MNADQPADDDSSPPFEVTERRSVQQYLDETPCWSDGTRLAMTPLTRMQWQIWGLASAGKFFEGLVVFMTGVALPLIVAEFGLNTSDKGVISASALFGILVGASALGGLADVVGRKRMFIFEMLLFVIFLLSLVFSSSYLQIVVSLFGLGLALGCDYPTAHMIISENIPSNARGKLVLSAFGFQAFGALAGTAVGYLVLYDNPQLEAWRWMYASALLPALLVLVGRFFIPDSAHWLVSRGRIADAEQQVERLLRRKPPYPVDIRLRTPSGGNTTNGKERAAGYAELFSRGNRRATLLASLPWFLQDLGTYGIGIFTPTILATAIGARVEHPHNLAAVIYNDMLAARGAAVIDVLLIVGIVLAIVLADRVGRIRLQILGFIGCAAGLLLAALSAWFEGATATLLIFAGFMLFNLMNNLGPNAQTYLLSGEVFATSIRGKGAGFAASFAKIGAVTTAFAFPVLLADIGTSTLLAILIVTSLAGALITWLLRIETRGLSLEDIGKD